MTELERFLAPIEGDDPSGIDLRSLDGDLTFDRVRDLRKQIDVVDDPGGEGKEPEWTKVAAECEEALGSRTKDLELAAWLAESWAHTDGFAGLARGFDLIQALLDRFWDGLHPGLEDGELFLPVRCKPLSWMGSSDGTHGFLRSVKQVILATQADGAPLRWLEYEEAQVLDSTRATNPGRAEELVAAGMMSGEAWRAGIEGVSADVLRTGVAEIAECEKRLQDLAALCDERFGEDEAPLLVPLSTLLSDMREYLAERLPDEVGVATDAGSGETQGEAAQGPLSSREQALEQLAQIAAYLRRTDPHSPVWLLVERAVKWGHMSYPDLMRDFIKDISTLNQMRETLGLPDDE